MGRIVIADDSAMARMFTQRCLEMVGFKGAEFVEAGDGEEALEALRAAPADLLVVDLNMPVLDGVETMARIAASPKLNPTPVLVVTGAGKPEIVAKLEAMGVMGVLKKPMAPPALKRVLAPLLA